MKTTRLRFRSDSRNLKVVLEKVVSRYKVHYTGRLG